MSADHATAVSSGFGFAPITALPDISASDLKNKFSEVARLAAREPVAVTRHNRREYVILTASQYEEFQQSRLAPLQSLATDFDQMVARMNTPKDRTARTRFFKASAVKPSAALAKLKKSRTRARPPA
jgi:prevent-host-death family protein